MHVPEAKKNKGQKKKCPSLRNIPSADEQNEIMSFEHTGEEIQEKLYIGPET